MPSAIRFRTARRIMRGNLIGRVAHPGRAAVEDVGVDHRRGHVPMSQELLNRPDVVAVLEQVGGKETRRECGLARLDRPAGDDHVLEDALQHRLV